jgi:hypothetical protein
MPHQDSFLPRGDDRYPWPTNDLCSGGRCFITGVIVMALSNFYSLLMLGCAFVGLGVGVGLAVSSSVRSLLIYWYCSLSMT